MADIVSVVVVIDRDMSLIYDVIKCIDKSMSLSCNMIDDNDRYLSLVLVDDIAIIIDSGERWFNQVISTDCDIRKSLYLITICKGHRH